MALSDASNKARMRTCGVSLRAFYFYRRLYVGLQSIIPQVASGRL